MRWRNSVGTRSRSRQSWSRQGGSFRCVRTAGCTRCASWCTVVQRVAPSCNFTMLHCPCTVLQHVCDVTMLATLSAVPHALLHTSASCAPGVTLSPYVPGLCPLPAASSALSVAEPPAAQDCEETLARKDADIEQAHRKVSAAPLMAHAACCHGCIAHRNAGLARLPSTRSCAHVRGHQALHIPTRRASSSGSLAAADPTWHDPIACHSVWRPRLDLHGIGLTPCLTCRICTGTGSGGRGGGRDARAAARDGSAQEGVGGEDPAARVAVPGADEWPDVTSRSP